jgi:hypothetical protein
LQGIVVGSQKNRSRCDRIHNFSELHAPTGVRNQRPQPNRSRSNTTSPQPVAPSSHPQLSYLTVKDTGVVLLTPPDDPVTTNVYVPAAALPTAFTVICEVVTPVMLAALKLTVTFFGTPEADSAIVGAPCSTVALIVLLLLPPLTVTVIELGLALIEKFTADAVIVSVTGVVLVTPPPVPVTVSV